MHASNCSVQLAFVQHSSSLWCNSFHFNTDGMQLMILVSLPQVSLMHSPANTPQGSQHDLHIIPSLKSLSHLANIPLYGSRSLWKVVWPE